jgi:glycosyltransferase involved in cell wall biosynthesis
MKSKKPRIALVVDVDNWAFANIARQVIKNLGHKYDFQYIVMDGIDNIIKVLFLVEDCDVVHFFWRGQLLWLNDYPTHDYLQKLGFCETDEYIKELMPNLNISTAVYDHLFLDNKASQTKEVLKYVKNYYVCSKRLNKIYSNLEGIKRPKAVVTDGVDLKKFFPKNLKRFDTISTRKIVIGWAGNSKWTSDIEDFKGVHTILKPALEELKREGYGIEEYFADRVIRMIPHDKMNDYYSKIDVYICPSKIEGTPNPVLESMACGVPVISTDVGIVPDVFGKKQKKMILEERSKECLKEKLVYLFENKGLFKELSEENLNSIKGWSWVEKCKDFDRYFVKCLRK